MAETRAIDHEAARLGPYTLLESCGAGPRGQVFKAESKGRFFALKIYHAKTWLRRDDLESLLRSSGLCHPNILAVEDLGAIDGWQYSASRYLHGDTLGKVLANLREEPPRPDSLCPIGPATDGAPQPDHICRCVRMIQKVAEGLQAAHDEGVIHGRISTENLIFSPSGMLMLMDFGGGGHLLASSLYYRAPEELLPKSWPAHKGSDIYALGAVLYEMLTLSPPHGDPENGASEPGALRKAILAGSPPPPSSMAGEIPPSLDACVKKAMARGPENRYASASDLADDLGRFLSGENPRAAIEAEAFAPARPSSRFKLSHRLIAASVLLALTAGALWYTSPDAGGLLSLNPGNTQTETRQALGHIVRAMKALQVGERAAARAAVSAARKLLPLDERLKELAHSLKDPEK